ncbi:uncharacterized protein METZ01_LOCUS274877, partial [marine metagenome]
MTANNKRPDDPHRQPDREVVAVED